MSANKNPISLLQEKAVALFHELPLYEYKEIRNQEFKCLVKLCDFTVEASAVGKKLAKTKAAEAMLLELGLHPNNASAGINNGNNASAGVNNRNNVSGNISNNVSVLRFNLPSQSQKSMSTSMNSGNQSPSKSIGNQSPVRSLGNQSPVRSLGNQSPVRSLGNQYPVRSLGNQSSLRSLNNQSPVNKFSDPFSVNIKSNSSPVRCLSPSSSSSSFLMDFTECDDGVLDSPDRSSSSASNFVSMDEDDSMTGFYESNSEDSSDVNNFHLNLNNTSGATENKNSMEICYQNTDQVSTTEINNSGSSTSNNNSTTDVFENSLVDSSSAPVSFLQEQMLKVNCVPDYVQVCVEDHGTNKPTFYFEVKAGGESAIGSGLTKKEAKANAALSLLDIFGIPFKGSDEVDYDPSENPVGTLMTYCQHHFSDTPKYDVVDESGQAHKKTFTIRCTVGPLWVEQNASTKKKAKHLSAKAMLIELQKSDVLPEGKNPCIIESKINEPGVNDPAWKRLNETGVRNKIKINSNFDKIPLRNYLYLFENDYYGKSETLARLRSQSKSDIYQLENPRDTFITIMAELNIEHDFSSLLSKKNFIFSLSLRCSPPWSFVETGPTEFETRRKLYISALEFLFHM